MTYDLVIPKLDFVHHKPDDFRRVLQFETSEGDWLDISDLVLKMAIVDKAGNEIVTMEGGDFIIHELVYQVEIIKPASFFHGMSCFNTCYHYTLKDTVNNTTLIKGEFKISE